ncbi:unnamed protein product [Phytomonas sp. Hart1]|nr:unnamed protein product [Phytomonas sp. Hart1]|eukprot:CCW70212.1 unnamed protein product [Phytomonas sp. isolate Hart1]
MSDDSTSQLDNLEDLESIELSDEFINNNIHNLSFEKNHFRQNINSLCETFLVSFFGDEEDNLLFLYNFFKENTALLTDIEKVLQTFISQLDSIQADIVSVQESIMAKSITLKNILSTESILRSAITRLVIPPEVVQVITQSNEQELGMQFKHCVKELLRYLRHRVDVPNDFIGTTPSSHQNSKNVDPSLSADDKGSVDGQDELHIPFKECRVYSDLMDFMDSLTLYACWKIKSFLSQRLNVLTIKGTNVWIHQENVLMPFSFYVYFLQSAAPLLNRNSSHPQSVPSGEPSKTLPASSAKPYDLAQTLYEEFKAEYCKIMFQLYLKRVQDYVLTCHSMEFNTTLPVPSPTDDSFYALPLITDPQTALEPELLQFSGRGEIFSRLFSSPLIPVIEKAHHRRHSYEETFRSLLSVMCDITTHEYLFACEFFSGDVVVFVEVFRPTIQFIVDYIAEVVLGQGGGAVCPILAARSIPLRQAGVAKDTYGLLLLIRQCHEFRAMMRHGRRLCCLDGLFDSLLGLLRPAYNATLHAQFVALREVAPRELARAMAPVTERRLRVVHPVVRSFTTFSAVLMGLLLGLLLSEERQRAEGELLRDEWIASGTPRSGEGQDHLDELRELALQQIAKEEEGEAADRTAEFMMLVSKLEFIRLGVIQLVQELGQCILDEETDASVREHLEPLLSCFMLNNLYYILQQYHQHHIILTETNPMEEGQEDKMGLGIQRDESLPLDIRDNFHDLKDTYLRYRTEFVENIVRKHMPAFFNIIQNGESSPVEEIKEATDTFMISWQSALDRIMKNVYQLISDSDNAQQINAQICMNILIYNTRFHAIIAKALKKNHATFDNCPLRSLIVTNQTMLQYMRGFLSSLPLTTDE